MEDNLKKWEKNEDDLKKCFSRNPDNGSNNVDILGLSCAKLRKTENISFSCDEQLKKWQSHNDVL